MDWDTGIRVRTYYGGQEATRAGWSRCHHGHHMTPKPAPDLPVVEQQAKSLRAKVAPVLISDPDIWPGCTVGAKPAGWPRAQDLSAWLYYTCGTSTLILLVLSLWFHTLLHVHDSTSF